MEYLLIIPSLFFTTNRHFLIPYFRFECISLYNHKFTEKEVRLSKKYLPYT